jgi:hypothetical protein
MLQSVVVEIQRQSQQPWRQREGGLGIALNPRVHGGRQSHGHPAVKLSAPHWDYVEAIARGGAS